MRRTLSFLLIAGVVSACATSFDILLQEPPVPTLEITGLTVDAGSVWPGQEGILVTVSLHNAGTGTANGYVLDVSPQDPSGVREDVEVRQAGDVPPLGPGAAGGVGFLVAISTTSSLQTFTLRASLPGIDTPAIESAPVVFAPIREVLVERKLDDDGGAGFTLREAILDAVATPGIERITFTLDEFPAGTVTNIPLLPHGAPDEGLPAVDGTTDPIVIEGNGRVSISLNGAQKGTSIFALRVIGPATVSGLVLDGWEQASPSLLQQDNSCFGTPDDTGGAVRLTGANATLRHMLFSDRGQDYARSCWHAAVRVDEGTGHRIRDSVFEAFNGDAIRIRAGVSEISGSLFRNDPQGNSVEEREMDSGIVIEDLAGEDLLLAGNLLEGASKFKPAGITTGSTPAMSGVGIAVEGTDSGAVLIVNNAFVRNESAGVARRGPRALRFVNNLYVGSTAWDVESGAGVTMSAETFVEGQLLCNPSCPSASQDTATYLELEKAEVPGAVLSSAGDLLLDWTPTPGSPLVDTGTDVVDRNGTAPGRFDGDGADRGAVETP